MLIANLLLDPTSWWDHLLTFIIFITELVICISWNSPPIQSYFIETQFLLEIWDSRFESSILIKCLIKWKFFIFRNCCFWLLEYTWLHNLLTYNFFQDTTRWVNYFPTTLLKKFGVCWFCIFGLLNNRELFLKVGTGFIPFIW